ncbi:putative ribonuclease H-like domain-containing protein [Tanacetum coccineum]
MRPFGCPLTILNTLDFLGKFDGKSDEGYLLGYSTSSKAFRGQWAYFNNMDISPLFQSYSTLKNFIRIIQRTNSRRSDTAVQKTRGKDSKAYFSTTSLGNYIHNKTEQITGSSETAIFACFSLSRKNPRTYFASLQDERWVEAMQEEFLHFKLQKVWVLVDLLYGKKVIGTKWVFRNKRIEAIRLFLAFASYMGFTVYQMDVKSAFLYGTIKEEVYVHQPPGFVDPAHPNKVYKVIKALYGLHQAPRAWYETLSSFLMKNGFRRALRPGIMFAVCACARFQVTPKASHLNAVKRIFRYLKHQTKLGLWYPRDSPFELEAYLDSDYGGASLDRKSTTGGCQFLGRRLISWKCKKQTIVANSTTEAEYVAAANYCGQDQAY